MIGLAFAGQLDAADCFVVRASDSGTQSLGSPRAFRDARRHYRLTPLYVR